MQLPAQIQWSGSQPTHLASLLWHVLCDEKHSSSSPHYVKRLCSRSYGKSHFYLSGQLRYDGKEGPPQSTLSSSVSNSPGPLLFSPKSLLWPSAGKAPSQPPLWSELVWTQMTSPGGRIHFSCSPRRKELCRHHTLPAQGSHLLKSVLPQCSQHTST